MSQPLPIVSNKSPGRSLLSIFLNVILGFVIIGPLIGFAVAQGFYDGDLVEAMKHPETKTDLLYPLMLQLGIGSLIGLILLPIFQLRVVERKTLAPFFPSQPRILFVLLLLIVLAVNFIVAISPITQWNMTVDFPDFLSGFEKWARAEEDKLGEITKAATAFGGMGDLLLGVLVVAIIPGIGEELVFRGLIQREFWRSSNNIHISIWLTATIFSIIHFQFYGFLPRLLLGALFGYLYYWSGNLLVPIFAHIINNALGVIGIYLYRDGSIPINPEESASAPVAAVAVSVLITAGLLYYIWKFYRDQRASSGSDESEPSVVSYSEKINRFD